METHFIAHDAADTVGVVVVEKVLAGQEVTGWIMETDETVTIKALVEVPLGHKLALADIKNEDTIINMETTLDVQCRTFPKGVMCMSIT